MATVAPSQESHHWWAQAIRGLAAVVFGVIALVWPGITLFALVAIFGIYAIVDGIFAVVAAVRAAERHVEWWPYAVEGVFGLIAGVLAFVWPGLTALVLLYLIAIWAIVTGVVELIAAFRLSEWALGIAGALSVVFGILLVVFPGTGALSIVWLIGIYAIVFGIFMLVHSFRTRGQAQVGY